MKIGLGRKFFKHFVDGPNSKMYQIPDMNAKQLAAQYIENEADNSYSENVALLANNFGTREDKMIAAFNITLRDSIGYRSPQLTSAIDAMHARLFENIRAEYVAARKN